LTLDWNGDAAWRDGEIANPHRRRGREWARDRPDVALSWARSSMSFSLRSSAARVLSSAVAAGEVRSVGPFRLVRQLGHGGFAPVFLAEEIHDRRKLRDAALKLFFLPDGLDAASAEAAAFRDGVLGEARALCRVEHPNVVRFYSVQRDDARGVLALAMEHVAGESLDARLRAVGALSEGEVLEIGAAVAWALSAVHQAGLVHRDVKPGNIMRGAGGYKLIDFGIVTSREPDEATSKPAVEGDEGLSAVATTLMGTTGYIAPECLLHGAPASPGSDLYALGATLYKLLHGSLPTDTRAGGRTVTFDPHGAEAATRPTGVVGEAPEAMPPRSDGPLDELIAQLLSSDPRMRPRYAEWVAQELERLGARPAIAVAPEEARAVVPVVTAAALTSRQMIAAAPVLLAREPPLVGRKVELAAIDRALAQAREGRLQIVVVTGPLGVGRTRLLDAAVARLGLPAGRVLRAPCSPERRSLLRPLTRALEALPDAGGQAFAALAEAIESAARPGAPLRESEAESAVEGVEEALLWAAADEPLAIAVDDLQWADPLTLALIRLLVDRARSEARAGRLLILATARQEPNPSPALRALVSRVRSEIHPAVGHLALGPLTGSEAAELAASVGPLEPELARAVVRASGRVPFFLLHALLAWRETGAIAFRDGAYRAEDERALQGDVPGVGDFIEARLAAVFEDPGDPAARAARKALAAAALYGGGLPVETMARVCGDDESLEIALAALVDSGLLTVTGDRQEYGFAQEMVRWAALNLGRTRPWFFRLHRALLDAIAESPTADTDAAFLATGYEKLGAAEPARRSLARAMETATAAGLFTEAAELGDRLAALSATPGARSALEVTIVGALVRGRRFAEARERLDRLDERSELLREAEVAETTIRRRIHRLEVARGLHEAADVDASLPADADALGDVTRSCEARMALAGVSPPAEALRFASEAVELSTRADPSVEMTARVLRMELIYASPARDLALAERDLRRALAIATATSSIWQEVQIEGDLAALEAETGRADEAISRLRRLIKRAASRGMRGQVRLLTQNLAAVLLRAGRAKEAAETAEEAALLAISAGDPVLGANAWSIRADAQRRLGDLDAALVSIGAAEQIQRQRGDRMRALTLLRRRERLIADASIFVVADGDDHPLAATSDRGEGLEEQRLGLRGIAGLAAQHAEIDERVGDARRRRVAVGLRQRQPPQQDRLRPLAIAFLAVEPGQRAQRRRIGDRVRGPRPLLRRERPLEELRRAHPRAGVAKLRREDARGLHRLRLVRAAQLLAQREERLGDGDRLLVAPGVDQPRPLAKEPQLLLRIDDARRLGMCGH
jgi:eukaryotic-like serine/threonine-protein kinase